MFIVISLVLYAWMVFASSTVSFEIFHIADIHGWIYGHRHEKYYDAYLSDIVDYIECVRNRKTTLFFGSGDYLEGSGLSIYNADAPSDMLDMTWMAAFDATTLGNHDLSNNALLASTLQNPAAPLVMTNLAEPDLESVGGVARFREYSIGGLSVVVLGFMYSSFASDHASFRAPEECFAPGAAGEVAGRVAAADLVVALNHFSNSTYPSDFAGVIEGVRSVNPSAPLLMLGGHGHAAQHGACVDATATAAAAAAPCFFADPSYFLYSLNRVQVDIVDGELTLAVAEVPANTAALRDQCDSDGQPTRSGKALRDLISERLAASTVTRLNGYSAYTYRRDADPSSDVSLHRFFFEEVFPATAVPRLPAELGGTSIAYVLSRYEFAYDLYRGLLCTDDILSVAPFGAQLLYSGSAVDAAVLAEFLAALPESDFVVHHNETADGPFTLVFTDTCASGVESITSDAPAGLGVTLLDALSSYAQEEMGFDLAGATPILADESLLSDESGRTLAEMSEKQNHVLEVILYVLLAIASITLISQAVVIGCICKNRKNHQDNEHQNIIDTANLS
eukprot:gnl/Chilomastix_cuspidata/2351.p1 GENE.gnl/Chilomastix_cuspidata/2351~~gnl/Chilomastix_cuspidata/2351.p1  ORF type:complete len:585 (+),score=103.89 gnl/Chilomastix_cuspidata/2351:66-1757(+)